MVRPSQTDARPPPRAKPGRPGLQGVPSLRRRGLSCGWHEKPRTSHLVKSAPACPASPPWPDACRSRLTAGGRHP
ncbi:hypothetical protein E5S69_14375 [Cupriavidus necator]|nr:hypothetical protein [Cupriavidus necator]